MRIERIREERYKFMGKEIKLVRKIEERKGEKVNI